MDSQDYIEVNAKPVKTDFMEASESDEEISIKISDDSDSEVEPESKIQINSGGSDSELELVDRHPKRTANEIDEDRVELVLASQLLPERLQDDSPIEFLGHVYCSPNPYALVIQSSLSGGRTPLDADSILTLEDRTVVGKVFETFGQVKCPFYLVRFPNPALFEKASRRWAKESQALEAQNSDEIDLGEDKTVAQPEIASLPPTHVENPQEKFPVGTKVYFGVELATIIPLEEIKKFKGTDASNLFDESTSESEDEISENDQEEPSAPIQRGNMHSSRPFGGRGRGRGNGRGRGSFQGQRGKPRAPHSQDAPRGQHRESEERRRSKENEPRQGATIDFEGALLSYADIL